MKVKELAATLACLQRVMADPRLEPAQWEKLRKSFRELENVRRSGKLDRFKVFRATLLISSTLLEIVSDPQPPGRLEPSSAAQRVR
jgi:hypothetical protein